MTDDGRKKIEDRRWKREDGIDFRDRPFRLRGGWWFGRIGIKLVSG
jgi:hypothetical protein